MQHPARMLGEMARAFNFTNLRGPNIYADAGGNAVRPSFVTPGPFILWALRDGGFRLRRRAVGGLQPRRQADAGFQRQRQTSAPTADFSVDGGLRRRRRAVGGLQPRRRTSARRRGLQHRQSYPVEFRLTIKSFETPRGRNYF